ncbi:hypothetical protein B5G43_00540 [Flavonifractor sp. An92]|uniref:hypothetical protein n=1 Tax=Flavonifractor sp. An92 TaxID=1965666 RepID=UPI000B39541F|nr:hypothetical protein [Flavonifractor sp. An92]OUN08617.1 hypothetical protein B5G43_00540 [Flavonifractor sp. An92]
MSLYTERHGMRTPIERTYSISIKTYSRLFDCCSRYFEYLAWKYPVECPDGNGCCGLDFKKFSEDMEFEIPTLFRREGRIDKPQSIQFPFDDEPIDDEFDQYALIDLIEFVAQNIRDITQKRYHDFFRHNDLFFGGTNEIAEKFIKEINNTFQKAGLLYQLTTNLEVERIEETAILSEKIEKDIQAIKEPGLHELLIVAVQKHKSPYPDDQKDAVEKIWDAFERLKTYYIGKKKNESADQIISDMSEGKEAYIKLFTAEFKLLTEIGNNYRIRHHETDKIDITDIRHYDYFFNRCLALIGTAIQYLK